MMKIAHIAAFSLTMLFLLNGSTASFQILTSLIQRNILGEPSLHQEQSWPFDPDVGIQRSAQYQQINGIRGEKAIERLGLGVDGNEERRLLEQRRRDEGHLGGLNFFRP